MSTFSGLAEDWNKIKTRDGNGTQPFSVDVSKDRQDFHLAVYDDRKASPSVVFSLIVEKELHNGFMVRIDDKVGLLDGIRVGQGFADMPSDCLNMNKSLIGGPYPVLDADLLLDRVSGRIYSPENLQAFGIERSGIDVAKDPEHAHLAHEDCGGFVCGRNWIVYPWTLKEVEEELSSRKSFVLGNYSWDDCVRVSDELSLDRTVSSSEELIKTLCDRLEAHVEKRELHMDWNHNPDFAFSFVSDNFLNVKEAEQDMIQMALTLKGVNPNPSRPDEVLIGRVDGYEVVCRNRSTNDLEMGKAPYLAVTKDGKSVSFLNAVVFRHDLLVVALKAYSIAQKKDRAVKRFEEFMRRVSPKRSGGIKRK